MKRQFRPATLADSVPIPSAYPFASLPAFVQSLNYLVRQGTFIKIRHILLHVLFGIVS